MNNTVEIAITPLVLLVVARTAGMMVNLVTRDMDPSRTVGYFIAMLVQLAALWWLTVWL